MARSENKTYIPPLSSIFSFVAIFFLIFGFFNGSILKFYASILFFIYHYVQHMWLSVIGLGVVQTFIMIPFRITNLTLSANVKEFEKKVEDLKKTEEQQFLIKETIHKGNPVLLWYIFNFFAQTISYLSIGRLFLLDFYNQKLSQTLLFDFVPYPQYPIKDPIFKLPYPIATQTRDYGLGWVFVAWGLILLYKLLHTRFIAYYRQLPDTKKIPAGSDLTKTLKSFFKHSGGFLTLFFVLAWVILRNFPLAWDIRIFSGDVGLPNYRLNAITAVGAFIVVIWLNMPKINRKADLARQMGISENIIFKTQKQLFLDTLRSATLLGIGAYYITRLIPSAFELSIFTLEIISLISPLTIDRLILPRFKHQKPTSSD
ncbi:hypothetical protein ACFL18_01870 [Patescibacteria group bacterium]